LNLHTPHHADSTIQMYPLHTNLFKTAKIGQDLATATKCMAYKIIFW